MPIGTFKRYTFKDRVFPGLRDKRMSELTEEQMEDAHEDWVRANYAWVTNEHVAFLLSRIDALRQQIGVLKYTLGATKK